jgi:hypothetical protein
MALPSKVLIPTTKNSSFPWKETQGDPRGRQKNWISSLPAVKMRRNGFFASPAKIEEGEKICSGITAVSYESI